MRQTTKQCRRQSDHFSKLVHNGRERAIALERPKPPDRLGNSGEYCLPWIEAG